jgi:hypothetical protein
MNNQLYLPLLIDLLKTNDFVTKQEQLKSTTWTKSCFELLSQIVSDKLSVTLNNDELITMGSTISYKTLKNMFDGTYNVGFPLDPRTLNTLNKLAKFTGYSDWNNFTAENKQTVEEASKHFSDEEQVLIHVKNALSESFKAFHKLSTNDKVLLKTYFKEKSSAYNRIAEVVYHNKINGLVLSNKYNPSNFELLDIKIDKITEDAAYVMTKEYWLLCWWNQDEFKYHSRVKKIFQNNYVLEKSGKNDWIVTNIISADDIFETF